MIVFMRHKVDSGGQPRVTLQRPLMSQRHLVAQTGRIGDVCAVQCCADRSVVVATTNANSNWAEVEILYGKRVVGRFTTDEVIALKPSQLRTIENLVDICCCSGSEANANCAPRTASKRLTGVPWIFG